MLEIKIIKKHYQTAGCNKFPNQRKNIFYSTLNVILDWVVLRGGVDTTSLTVLSRNINAMSRHP